MNVTLLTNTLQHIKDNLPGWEQTDWRRLKLDDEGLPAFETVCGTAMCFAGEAVQLADPDAYLITTELLKKVRELDDKELAKKLSVECYDLVDRVIDLDSHVLVTLSPELAKLRGVDEVVGVGTLAGHAQKLLGLNYFQADELFNGNNDLEDLEALVGRFKDEATQPA